MDSTHNTNTEECGSCESGWTTYILSLDEVSNDNDGNISDDSVVSDASSGLTHQEQRSEDRGGGNKLDDGANLCSKPKIIEKKIGQGNDVIVKEEGLVQQSEFVAAHVNEAGL
ncbi:hypothetical protein DCAR_0312482 [Daucus carota subsp. sativus]|uniref:Uncharacterized protein n=1 Tax=Daucus carota subsp. sativus TaxID=79200 RepID=A0A166B1Q6_DAUCS|nr:hypothetical protein DCAR_0312482 [Daucus carota subsp. sativus]